MKTLKMTGIIRVLWLLLVGISAKIEAEAATLIVRQTETNALRLFWDADIGRSYRVLSRTNAAGGLWNIISPPITAAVTVAEHVIFPTRKSEIFRLVKNPNVGGALILTPEQRLSGQVTLDALAVSPPGKSVLLVELLDITGGETNVLDRISGEGLTDARFLLDTSTVKNGRRLLQIRVTDDNGYTQTGVAANEFLSDPIPVNVTNAIYLASAEMFYTGWKIRVEFGTDVKNGIWRVRIYDDAGAFTGSAEGNLSETNSDGYLVVEDAFIDDGGDERYRWFYDQYSSSFFDVFITVEERREGFRAAGDGETGTNGYYYRTRTMHRPNQRLSIVLEDPLAFPIPPESIDRDLLGAMFDVPYMGFAIFSYHLRLADMATDPNQTPQSDGWNKLWDETYWRNLNYGLAARESPFNPNPQIITDWFSFTHGWPGGIGRQNIGFGGQVSEGTLRALGFQKTNGLTFCFFDACSVLKGGFVDLLLLNGGGSGEISLQKLIKEGKFPHYGCGWTRGKYALLANRIIQYHPEYIQLWFETILAIDPVTGYFANTYEQARARARYLPNNPTTFNPFSGNWGQKGSPELYLDE